MKTAFLTIAILILALASITSAQSATDKDAVRTATREKLRQALLDSGPKKGIEIAFRQSDKQPFNFVGVKRGGFVTAEGFEIVVGVSNDQTIGFRIYPYYKGGYINIDKARNTTQLLRKIAQLNNTTFLFWGADDTGDVFTGYTFTLESGFPDEAIKIVISSIKNSDQFVGEMRPSIDGSSAP